MADPMPTEASIDPLTMLLPLNAVATRTWLLANGQASGLGVDRLDNYVKSGRLRKLAHGVYCHRHAQLSWQSVLASCAQSLPVHAYVGGQSALQECGFVQYLPLGTDRTIDLYSVHPSPSWLDAVAAQLEGVQFRWHKVRRLWPHIALSAALKQETGIAVAAGNNAYLQASPERACLELLHEVPTRISFEHADEIMQALNTLSPRALGVLLAQCNSVKSKRLFCWFAERHEHPWWKKLENQPIELGAGKRVVQPGGRLHNRYLITVPASMYIEDTAPSESES